MSIRVPSSFFAVLAAVALCFNMGTRASTITRNETDQQALLAFKSKITNDPLGVLGSWNKSIHFCQWHGITCSRRHQRVTILDLHSLKLVGSISPSIGNLSFLKELILQNNSFTQKIPSEIGSLRRLKVLNLYNNSFGGEIPSNISGCSNLIEMGLDNNKLVGTIPSEFGSLLKIEFLYLGDNILIGNIPSSLGNLSSLTKLSLSRSNLDGSVPDTLGHLKNLEVLQLFSNNFSGTIPSTIFNISSITEFDVGLNQIQGDIPVDLGFTLPNIQLFSIAANQITGAIPPSISNASNMEVFQFTGNKLTGEVPYMEKLQRLFWFAISSNHFGSGGRDDLNFLCSMTNASSLKILAINDNNFGGFLPRCIGNFSSNSLAVFAIDNNKISGRIPIEIGKLVSLERLDMWNNKLSGTIPPIIGDLRNLEIVYLQINRLSGNIPHSTANLKKLSILVLADNFLQGGIPSSLGQHERLIAIDLSDNNLSGIIPPQLIGLSSLSLIVNFSGNQLTGSIPSKVENLKNLGILDVSRNMLSGEIPSTLGSCIVLEQLRLQDNFFHGDIPSSLSSLKALRVLDLSQNNLSGEIPNFLTRFKLLENLNLSHNDLEGMVPTEGVFKNSSATSVTGNNKLCGGIPELQLPKCTKNITSNQKISRVLKVIIATVATFAGLVMLSFFIFCWLKRGRGLSKQPSEPMLRKTLQNLSYESLLKATDGFSSTRLIGVGSFGSVYKGIFDQDGTVVAIKVLNLLRRGASKSFMAECKALRNIRHRNLVRVITSCSSIDFQGNDFKALVYEYMPNGNLETWLHPDDVLQNEQEIEVQNLTLLQRINIAIDVASALDYLHHHCHEQILHCDIKPSNVLLDNDLTAHVGDFGLARFHQDISNPNQSSSVGVRGTIGYAAPEYGLGSDVSTNGDVYSYGILLLQMLTRKKPTDKLFEGDMNLHSFARMALPDHVMDIVDPLLQNNDEDLDANSNQRQRQARINSRIECLISLVRIGVTCSMESPHDRMNITNVISELQSVKNILTCSTGKEVKFKRFKSSPF